MTISKLLNAEANGGPGDYGVDGAEVPAFASAGTIFPYDLLKVRYTGKRRMEIVSTARPRSPESPSPAFSRQETYAFRRRGCLMTTDNPYNDNDRAPVWSQGYRLGYDERETDHAPPVPPELVGVFSEGEQAGRDDRRSEIPVGSPAPEDPRTAADQHLGEAIGEIMLEVAKHGWGIAVFGTVGGLISLLTQVVSIPGDVQLRPLDPDWTGKADGRGTRPSSPCAPRSTCSPATA